MQILVDENVPVQGMEMLRRVLPGHEVRHVSEIKWAGSTSPERKRQLQAQQDAIFAAVPVPAGAPELAPPAD